ncbi:MAG: hypothetical protein Kow0074_07930 [Candidatus Zixiibacteriota bacterium]
MPIRSAIVLLLTVFAVAAWMDPVAAETVVEARVDRNNVSVGDAFRLEITVSSDGGDIADPAFPDMRPFEIFSSGRTQNISWVNGVMTSSITFEYGLRARTEGEHTIGPVVVKIGNERYETDPIVIKVAPSRIRRPGDQPEPEVSDDERPQSSDTGHRIFITAEVDRDTVYVNQAVTYTFRFYQGERLLQNPEYTKPNFPGFWVEDLPPQRKYSKVIDGVRYEVTEIRYALFATDAGRKQISPAQLKAKVRAGRSTRRRPFSPFDDDFLGIFDRGKILELSTDPVNVTVLPFPEQGQPEDFSGLVGSFTLTAALDTTTVTVGDPLTVRLTISGEGNIESAPMPSFDTLADLRTFSAGSQQKVSTEGYKISGTKTYEQVFVPQRPGTYRLPSFSLTYFEPGSGRYKTLHTDTLEFTAVGAAADFTIPSLRLNPDELSDLASDVRFIKTEADGLSTRRNVGLGGWPFWIGHALPLLGLGVFLGWRRRTMKLAADPVGRRRRGAFANAVAKLKQAELNGQNATMDDVASALGDYFSDRFNRPAHGARRHDMREAFANEGVDETAVCDYLSLLDECDRSKYARIGNDGAVADAARRAREVLARLEGNDR